MFNCPVISFIVHRLNSCKEKISTNAMGHARFRQFFDYIPFVRRDYKKFELQNSKCVRIELNQMQLGKKWTVAERDN